MVESAIDFCEEEFKMKSLMVLVGSGLADGTDETFVAAGGVDTDEIENLAVMEVAFWTF